MDKKFFMDYLPEELIEMGIEPKFRVKQLYNWVYRKYVDNFEEMKNIPKLLREKLKKEFIINPFELVNHEISMDETEKFLFKLKDGRTVETVLIKMKENKYTVCVSTQVGCKVGCAFCLTAKGGFVRNLSAGEIVAQVWWMKKFKNFDENKALNVVYMGMGEPLDNYENLVKAIKILSHPDGMNISTRRQTVSTSGIAPKIKKLGNENLGVNLAISLHAVDNETREKLIPMNKAYNIESVIDAIREFPIDKRKKVMFEYLVIKDVNDDINAAKKLVKLLNGIPSKVNLIYFNPYPGTKFQRPDDETMKRFQDYLIKKGILCTIRKSKGMDISAACGQLREKKLKEENG
ncbi:23S rRNA (adenine2503-C2)-methyltransferase [Lebetimonas natsushimae]|uniref:Probable dual-specificity RNA methyltransferase RlmN n=1 Tax=Lebetimonas natsushimae TaxID=1936991 RepID=A0A292YB69_9BACT|nr:23S rRNA (adenine(2503)-C(2))-methyltransferase RlmN [Lebetimonas natsushimae]GAX86763.1 23S rRNA (adenine2503-C2)-methyltransferase [Lebetimonas natsushimae]